jgi:hypothetical protein
MKKLTFCSWQARIFCVLLFNNLKKFTPLFQTWVVFSQRLHDRILLFILTQLGIKKLIKKIFSKQQEGPLTSSCTVWSIIFYLYCNPLLVTLHLSDTCIFDCAFLWIWEKCTAVLLSSCLCCFLDACRVGSCSKSYSFGCIWQFVSEWYSLTISVTSGVLVSGGHYGSLIPKYCRGYIVYSCSDIVWWWQHWRQDKIRWRLCGTMRWLGECQRPYIGWWLLQWSGHYW